MIDVIRNILTAIGGLTLLAAAILVALSWLSWRRETRLRDLPMPDHHLPHIPPDDYMTLHADLAAFERGETP